MNIIHNVKPLLIFTLSISTNIIKINSCCLKCKEIVANDNSNETNINNLPHHQMSTNPIKKDLEKFTNNISKENEEENKEDKVDNNEEKKDEKPQVIKIKSDSIILNGNQLEKLKDCDKPQGVINENHINNTNVYSDPNVTFDKNYTVEENDLKDKPYVIAVVELENNKQRKNYIISCLYYTDKDDNGKGLFQDCYSILNIKILESKNVTNMHYMFHGCSNLQKLYFYNFDTKEVTDMNHMFDYCPNLKNLDLSMFNTEKVTIMSCMFYGCKSLQTLNLSNFITTKVTSMNSMFGECSGLINLNLSSFNINNVTYLNHMFYNCKKLENLDISNFNTSKISYADISYIFYNCKTLKKNKIKLNNKENNEVLLREINKSLKL